MTTTTNFTNYNYTDEGARTYDAENRMTGSAGVSPATYAYDGDGRRVKRMIGTTETWQVYGIGGELLAEYTSNGTQLSKEYGYRNGELLITATITAGWGAPPSYTGPNPLSTGDQIKLENLTELRTAVNSLRSHAGLPPFDFTVDPNPQQNVTPVKADHIRQLRTALEGARTALGLSIGGYEHPTLTENFSLIYAVDFQELRGQVLSAWQTGGGVDIRWLVADQLGTPRMVFDQTGSLATVSRHDYLPFGEELYGGPPSQPGVGGRTTTMGYTSSDNVRQKFTRKERDNETGLDYFLARYYSSPQGRFTSVDPVRLTKYHIQDPQLWNGYSYGLNNPLTVIDIDGRFPWTIYVRSFIFTTSAGGGCWRGDGRGSSTDTDPNTASSRIRLNFTLDYDKRQIVGNPDIQSDPTWFYCPTLSRTGKPGVEFSPVGSLGSTASVDFHYWGQDPIPGGPLTPNVDVFANISIAEDKQKNILSVTGNVTGDKYPSTEAFIADQSGQKVFLGAKYEEGDIRNARGTNRDQLFKIDLKIRFNDKGNFVAVVYGRKTYTIQEWNKKVEGDF